MILESQVIVMIVSIITGGEIILAWFLEIWGHMSRKMESRREGVSFFVYILKYFKKYVSYDGELVRSKLLIQEDLLDWYFQHILLTARKSFYEPLKSKCSVKICKIIFQISKLWTFF